MFAVFGHLRESKRLAPILRAFRQAQRHEPQIKLLVSGRIISPDYARTIEPLLATRGVIRLDFLPEPDFWLHVEACDVGINLRYPSCGESSGIATRLMGMGKTVLLTAGEENSLYPEASYIPVEPGASEEEALADWMLLLARNRPMVRDIGARAANHIRTHNALDAVASEVLRICQSA